MYIKLLIFYSISYGDFSFFLLYFLGHQQGQNTYYIKKEIKLNKQSMNNTCEIYR